MSVKVLRPWTWMHRVPRAVVYEMGELTRRLLLSWRMLLAVTHVEFRKKYSGSALGILWYPLYSALLLGMYCFVYMVVFAVKFEDMGTYDFVLFVFAGLIPFLGFSDAIATSSSSIKANIALVKNTIFPVELIPVKHLLVSMIGLSISLVILLVMILPTRHFGIHLLYLPVPIAMLFVFTLAMIWILAALAVLIPDVTHIINVTLLLMIFISPIAYSLDDVPPKALALLYVNPMTYLCESFRFALIGIRTTPMWLDLGFGLTSLVAMSMAGTLFRKLMPLFSDYE